MAQSHDHFVNPRSYRPVFDYSRAGIERSYEESLRRLRLDRVQVLLLHDIDRSHHPANDRPIVRQAMDEALPTLHRLKTEGRVEGIGLRINEWDIGFKFLTNAEIDFVLLAGRYTLLNRTAFTSGFLDTCERRGVSVLAGGVFNSGFLAGGSHYDYRRADETLLKRRAGATRICNRHRVALSAAAVQIAKSHPAIASIVIGARSGREFDAIAEWSLAEMPASLWRELREGCLIPGDALFTDS